MPLSSPPTPQELHDLFSAPQWSEGVRAFDAALRTGGLRGVMDGLGLPERAGEGVGEFLEEVQRKSGDEDQDEEM
jgi:26S proteasome regulatory subunit N13